MPKYEEAPEVRDIASELIDKYHSHLASVRMCYIFRPKAWKSKGEMVLGKASKLGGKTKALSGYGKDYDGFTFVIEVAKQEFHQMDRDMKEALIDHELIHCILDENDNWKIVGHDFDGFNSVVKRHGFWTERLQRFKKTMQQMSLFDEDQHWNIIKRRGEPHKCQDLKI